MFASLTDNENIVRDGLERMHNELSPMMTKSEAMDWFNSEAEKSIGYRLTRLKTGGIVSIPDSSYDMYIFENLELVCLDTCDGDYDNKYSGTHGWFFIPDTDSAGKPCYNKPIGSKVGNWNGFDMLLDDKYIVSIGSRQFTVHSLDELYAFDLSLDDIEDVIDNYEYWYPGDGENIVYVKSGIEVVLLSELVVSVWDLS